jgi:carboxyl-terminal processing protease
LVGGSHQDLELPAPTSGLERLERNSIMKKHLWALDLASLVLLFPSFVSSATPLTIDDVTKTDPVAYLNRALDEMQSRALRRATVDWPRIRAEALERAANAKTTTDTYDAIRFALASLGDHHSSLHLTADLEKLESERKARHGNRQGSESTQGDFGPFVGRNGPEGRAEKFGGKTFALLVVTKCFPEDDRQFRAFETKLQKIVADLDRTRPSGWVVDLRGNVGGNMWPMLAGVGPVLGEGDDLGEFFTTDGHSVWRYSDGVAAEVENGKTDSYPAVDGVPYKLAVPSHVAVLIDRGTGSSGEAIAIAFRGRPHTRFFGEHTSGASTVNETYALPDGAALWLTIGVQADRTGKQYPNGLAPDDPIPGGNKILPDDQDRTLQAALQWLNGLQ